MHTRLKTVVAAAALALSAHAAQAIGFVNASTQDGSVVADFSGAGLISFDVDFRSFAPAVLNYAVDAADAAHGVDLSAVLRNNAGGVGFDGYTLALSQGGFAAIGSVTRQFAGGATTSAAGGSAAIRFDTPEFLDVELGNALGTTPGAANWTLTGLQAGSTLSVVLTPVPEPGGLALMLAGIGCIGSIARRRRR